VHEQGYRRRLTASYYIWRVFTKHTLAVYLQINSRIYDRLLAATTDAPTSQKTVVPPVPVVRGIQGDLHLVVGVLQPHHVVVVPGAVQVQLVLEETGS
jgi:hypothetical protein